MFFRNTFLLYIFLGKELLTGNSREVLFLKVGDDMAGEKLDKDIKEIAVAVIEASGKTYEEWLNEQHRNVIFTNSKLLKESLNLRKEIGN